MKADVLNRMDNSYGTLDSFINFLGIETGFLTRKSDLITILHQAQRIYGYLPLDVQEHIASRLNIDHSEITSIINFYSFFTTVPQNQKMSAYTSMVFSEN
ncbi:MAG TPA: NAD(P)H-dependent oxidoreductase subunit E [Chitinispirillaceae bacterium]|nr:NAD(P)H-dependent oxidoreductase subunit E [Chitinispirillaceae bacterium]